MSNISIKCNLKGLKNAFIKKMKKKDGTMIDVLIIPVADNHLFISERGAYLDLQAFDNPNPKADGKETHLIKQSLPTAVYKAMDDAQRKSMPLLGNATVWQPGASQTTAPAAQNTTAGYSANEIPDEDDLPF